MKYIIANWKANQNHAQVERFVSEITALLQAEPLPTGVELVVCPPAIFYSELKKRESELPFSVGLQDISTADGGAHTGEITRTNLVGLEPRYALVGHSERRREHGETVTLVNQKIAQLLALGTVPIVCFDAPDWDETRRALIASGHEAARIIFAYEPVSAISTSGTAGNLNPAVLRERAASWRQAFAPSWLLVYGGSVKPDNAGAYAEVCQGLLIGSASLTAGSLVAIARAFAG